MQDKTDEALKADVEENNIPESPTEEGNISEEPEVAETEEVDQPTEVEEQPETEDKKTANYRIRELNEEKKLAEEKARLAEERAKSLEGTIAELTGQVNPKYNPQVPQEFEPEPLIKPGEESIDPIELERRLKAREEHTLKRAQTLLEQRDEFNRDVERINAEAQASVKKYPQLDPDNEMFDKDLSETVTEATLAFVKSNRKGSVKEFVNKLMKPYLRSIDSEVGKQKEAITKQASQGALRPTQVPKGEKDFGDLSIKEMEARLGGVRK